jgi:hypothetical protein
MPAQSHLPDTAEPVGRTSRLDLPAGKDLHRLPHEHLGPDDNRPGLRGTRGGSTGSTGSSRQHQIAIRGRSSHDERRQKLPPLRQQFLKTPPRSAGARIVVTEPFDQLDLSALDAPTAALHVRLGRESVATFTHRLKRTVRFRARWTWSLL